MLKKKTQKKKPVQKWYVSPAHRVSVKAESVEDAVKKILRKIKKAAANDKKESKKS